MQPDVDGKVFIAIKVKEDVETIWLVDNQRFRGGQFNDVILACRRILSGDKALV